MRVLLGTMEIAGLLPVYRKGFEQLGHTVTTVIRDRNNYFKDVKYDIELLNPGQSYVLRYYDNKIKRGALLRVANFFQKNYPQKITDFVFKRLIKDHDLFVYLWASKSLYEDNREFREITRQGKKVIAIYAGSDIRHFKTFLQEFKMEQSMFPAEYIADEIDRPLRQLRRGERDSSMVLSVPDQSGLALRPYHHFQIPVDLDMHKYNVPAREIPVVVHAPSRPWIKGTDVIIDTLERLKNEGVKFELEFLQNVSNSELRNKLSNADVLVDEIILHGPGVLSFEAMAAGCAIATKHLESSPPAFRPPVVNINHDNIYEKLKHLLTDKDYRVKMANAAYEYVKKNNAAHIVVQHLINNLNDERPDYFPKFMRESYIPETPEDTNDCNRWTEYVKDTDWYKKHVTPGKREGLEF